MMFSPSQLCAGVALCGAVVLAGCGSSNSSPSPSPSVASASATPLTTPSQAPTGSAAAATPTAVPSTPAATAGPVGALPCAASGLSAAGTFDAAAGNDGFLVALTNHGPTPCTLTGYLPLDPGAPAIAVVHASSMLYRDLGAHQVTVAPGQAAYFGLGYSEVQGAAYQCADVAAMRLLVNGALSLPVGSWRHGSSSSLHVCNGQVFETGVSLQPATP